MINDKKAPLAGRQGDFLSLREQCPPLHVTISRNPTHLLRYTRPTGNLGGK